MDGVQPMPLPALHSAFHPVVPPGEQWYPRADFIEEIPDEAIEEHVEFAAQMPSWKSTMHLYPIDGAPLLGPDETPWGYRSQPGPVIDGVDPTRPTPRRSASGRSPTTRRCIRSRPAARM